MTSARSEGGAAMPGTRGVVYLHCCPAAIAPHVEWALAGVLARPVRLEWAWPMLVFEVTEQGTGVSDGERLAYVPGRGFHRSMVAANGDVVVGEERLRGLMERSRSADEFQHGLAELLGTAWDGELEPYRRGGDGAPVTLLHQVG